MRQASCLPLKRSAALFFGRSCSAWGAVLSWPVKWVTWLWLQQLLRALEREDQPATSPWVFWGLCHLLKWPRRVWWDGADGQEPAVLIVLTSLLLCFLFFRSCTCFKFYHLFYSILQNRRGNLLAKDVAKEWSAYILQIFLLQSYLRHQ